MKQGRTDRDWAVVAVMAFIAGAIAVWAITSKHPPQPRPPVDIDWPAWVQAVMSVVAILATAFVPRWIDAAKKRDSADQFIVLARYLADSARELHESAATNAGRRGLAMFGHEAEWKSIADGAMELSLDILPHADYLPVWLQLRQVALQLAQYHKALLTFGDRLEDGEFDDEIMDGYLKQTLKLYNDLIDIDAKHRGYRGYNRV